MEDTGLPPSPGAVRSPFGAAVPELRQSHKTKASRAVVSRLAAGEENNAYLVLSGSGERPRLDQCQMAGLCLFSVPRKPQAGRENNTSVRNAISRFASHQIHSEVSLDMAFLTQWGGSRPAGHSLLPLSS